MACSDGRERGQKSSRRSNASPTFWRPFIDNVFSVPGSLPQRLEHSTAPQPSSFRPRSKLKLTPPPLASSPPRSSFASLQLHQAFHQLADSLIVASQACRNFANNENDPSALAQVIASIAASGLPFGSAAPGAGKKGAVKTPEQEAKAEKKRKRAEKKANKDPNAPKRPASAYLMYQNEVRDQFKSSNPEVPYQDVLKMIGDSWKNLAEPLRKVSFVLTRGREGRDDRDTSRDWSWEQS